MERTRTEPGVDTVVAGPALAPTALARELWTLAQAAGCGLSIAEFDSALLRTGMKHNFGQPPGAVAGAAIQEAFYRSLRLAEFALAQGCAAGENIAWERFLALYRQPILQAAIAISGSATAGHELADSLTADLFGLREQAGERKSPLASYSGRGSLLGWLRSTLAQRHVDRHRRTYREQPLDDFERAAPTPAEAPAAADLLQLGQAVTRSLATLPAEDRYLLAGYFLDRLTLAELGRILNVHEATVSRRLKRLTENVRGALLNNLQARPPLGAGLSKRAAEERLTADPRDLEVNLRDALQTSQLAAFKVQEP